MFARRVAAWSIVASISIGTGQTSAGWIIDRVVKGEGGRQQILLQANRMKTIMIEADGKLAMAFILDLNAGTITHVDYQQRHYMTATVREYAEMSRVAQAAGSQQLTRAMKEMQEAMKDMPPDQRKVMEQMMRSQMPQAEGAPPDCREPRVEVRKTGQQATITGTPAVRYEVLADGKLESEIWVAKDIPAWQELDPKKFEQFTAEMAKAAPRCGSGHKRPGLPGDDPAWRVVGDGYPVRTVDRSGSGETVEVVKAESRTIPAAEFQPPAGFARKTLRETMGQ